MPQTSITIEPGLGIAGQLADIQPNFIRSATYEGVTDLPFGIAVKKGAADDGFLVPAAGIDKIIGILVRTQHVGTLGIAARTNPVQPKDTISVLAKGAAYVTVEEAVTPADPVYVRFADGVGDPTQTQKGSFRKSSDSSTAKLLRGARYLTSAGAGEVAIVEFDAMAENAAAVQEGDLYTIEATPGAEVANAIDVVCKIKDRLGNVVAAAREVKIRSLAPTDDQGDLAAATAAVGTLNKAVNPATGENVAWMTATAGGLFSFKVTDTAAESVAVEITAEGCRPRIVKLTFA